MSILGTILGKIFHRKPAAPAGTPPSAGVTPTAAPAPAAQPAPAAAEGPVDVAGILDFMNEQQAHKLNWRTSIVDLMKLTGMDSTLAERKELAGELGYTGDMERMGARNLGFIAGTASAYGLSAEDALRAITLDAATILGIDKHYGSLEAGKSATLFISTGDALDMRTNNVVRAFIDGRDISLDNRQKDLWKQYERRYRR